MSVITEKITLPNNGFIGTEENPELIKLSNNKVTINAPISSTDNIEIIGYEFGNGQFETGIEGWNTYKDLAIETPVDGTGGTSSIQFTPNKNNPLIGSGDAIFYKPASNCLGEGVSKEFTKSRGSLQKNEQIAFIYQTDINYIDDSFTVHIIDTGSNSIIASKPLKTKTTPYEEYIDFVSTTSGVYRFSLHCSTTSTVAMSLELDNVRIRDKESNIERVNTFVGSVVTDWKNFTPSANITNLPGTWSVAKWRRVGSNVEFYMIYSASGAATGNLLVNYQTVLLNPLGITSSGYVNAITALKSSSYRINGVYDGNSFFGNGTVVWAATAPFTWASGDSILFDRVTFPINQWSTNINLASEVQEFSYNYSTTTANDLVSFGYGAEGALIQAFAPTGTTPITKRVRFKSEIQPKDLIVVEILENPNVNSIWVPLSDRSFQFQQNDAGTTHYGCIYSQCGNKTDIDVSFYSKAHKTLDWSSLTSWKWRVRKISNGNLAESSGTGSSGEAIAVNPGYTLSNGQLDSDTTGYIPYADAAQVTPVDGTGGTSLLTFTSKTSSPLIGIKSGLITKPASNTQGHGVGKEFSIDRGQVISAAQVTLNYETSSGYVDGDLGLYVYDVTNASLLYPSVVSLPATYGKPASHLITFIPSNSNSYRLLFHNQTATTTAWTCEIDNVQIGNKDVAIGAAIGNWIKWQPTTQITNLPGSWDVNSKRRRVGSSLELELQWFASGPATGNISLPVGPLLAELGLTTDRFIYGDSVFATDFGTVVTTGVWASTFYGPGLQVWNTTNPFTWVSGDIIVIKCSIPIAQWTSNVNLTSDFQEFAYNYSQTTTSDSTSFAYGPEGAAIQAFAPTGVNAVFKDVRFKTPIQSTDKIEIEIQQFPGGPWTSSVAVGIQRTTDNLTTPTTVVGLAWVGLVGSKTDIRVYFYSKLNGDTTWASASAWKWRVRKISNGNMAEVPPTVRAEYKHFPATTANQPINYATKVEDAHNCVTTGASWKFTAPISGVYLLNASVVAKANVGTTFFLYKNGSIDRVGLMCPAVIADYGNSMGAQSIRLNAGDYIDLRCDQTNTNVYATDWYKITITRIGS